MLSLVMVSHWDNKISCYSDIQSNLDYLDSLGPDEIVQIIKGPDNGKFEY